MSVHIKNRAQVQPFVAEDGSIVHEIASPLNSALTRHSLAIIHHPPGTASREHYHLRSEEAYYVLQGHAEITIDGRLQTLGPGDVLVIVPGQRHTVCPGGEEELILLVTCVPAYAVDEVVFTE